MINAWGTRLRLRSLIAMGHNTRRMGEALDLSQQKVTAIVNGLVIEIPVDPGQGCGLALGGVVGHVPPTRTRAEKDSFRRARAKAARRDWCCPLGLDEELIDDPYYIPGSGWLPATGTGIAFDPFPLGA